MEREQIQRAGTSTRNTKAKELKPPPSDQLSQSPPSGLEDLDRMEGPRVPTPPVHWERVRADTPGGNILECDTCRGMPGMYQRKPRIISKQEVRVVGCGQRGVHERESWQKHASLVQGDMSVSAVYTTFIGSRYKHMEESARAIHGRTRDWCIFLIEANTIL